MCDEATDLQRLTGHPVELGPDLLARLAARQGRLKVGRPLRVLAPEQFRESSRRLFILENTLIVIVIVAAALIPASSRQTDSQGKDEARPRHGYMHAPK